MGGVQTPPMISAPPEQAVENPEVQQGAGKPKIENIQK